MDPNCTGPPCFSTIQDAVNAASHGDEVFVRSGTYNEQVRIAPPEANPPEFTLVLRAEQSGAAPVTVRHNETNVDAEHRDAVFEIYNYYNDPNVPATRPETASENMQVTIEGFEIFGEGSAAAISVWHRWNDPLQQSYTGLFIRDNYLETVGNHMATLPIGLKGAGQNGLHNQPLKWGEITNNEIVAFGMDPSTDGISTHHFVGKIANNRVSGNSEGIHVGYARLDYRHVVPVVPPEVLAFDDTIIEHNLFYCNPDQHGIHFAHASKGIVRNNIVVQNIKPDIGQQRVARGIHVGEPPNPGLEPDIEQICIDDPDECYDQEAVGDDAFAVQVKLLRFKLEVHQVAFVMEHLLRGTVAESLSWS